MRAEGDSILQELYGLDLGQLHRRQFTLDLSLDITARAEFPVAPWKPLNCFDIYVLARDHNMKTIAARALYECCRWPLAELKPDLIPALSPDVLWACALGRELLAKRGAAQLLKLNANYIQNVSTSLLMNELGPACEQEDTCGPVMEETYETIKLGLAPPRLNPVSEGYSDEFLRRLKCQLCGQCSQRVTRAIQNDAQTIWNSLPDILAPAMAGE